MKEKKDYLKHRKYVKKLQGYIPFSVLLKKLKHSHLKQDALQIKEPIQKKSWDSLLKKEKGYISLKMLVDHLRKARKK